MLDTPEKRRVLLLWIFVVLAALVGLSVLNPTYGEICAETKNAAPKDCATYDISRYALFKTLAFLKTYNGAVTAVATAFIAAFTIILARLGKRQIADTRILQRAYLSVQPDGIRQLDKPSGNAHVSIVVVNAGHLPARKIAWIINERFSSNPRLADFPINKTDADGANVLVPGGEMIQGGKPFAANDSIFYAAGDVIKYLYAWGAVYYDDGFGSERTTIFCHRYNCTNWTGRKIDHGFGRLHRFGNDAN